MIEFNPTRCKWKPAPEQREGTRALLKFPYFAIFDEPGAGKSKQVIDAACVLYEAGIIDTVVILCPSQVKPTWADRDFGQIQEHAWVQSTVSEMSLTRPLLTRPKASLLWAVIGFEYMIRHEKEISEQLEGRKILMVADESIKIATYSTHTTKVATRLADKHADRTCILNGTPGDMEKAFSQYRFLSSEFWPYENYFHYRAHFCVMGGPKIGGQYRKIVAFKHKDEFDRITVPYTLRRDKPASIPKKTYNLLSCTLSAGTWKTYTSMRKDMIAWLDKNASIAQQAVTRGLRLSQITSGFLGGVEDLENNVVECKELSCEKTEAFIEWIKSRYESKPELRFLVWCRFRPEIERLGRLLLAENIRVRYLVGGQSKADRHDSIEEFTSGQEACVLIGQAQAGGLGLNLPSADEEVFLSNDYNVITRLQAEDRPHRRGRTKELPVHDMLAYGPDGQKTIDHAILKALRDGVDLFKWTAQNWRAALSED